MHETIQLTRKSIPCRKLYIFMYDQEHVKRIVAQLAWNALKTTLPI